MHYCTKLVKKWLHICDRTWSPVKALLSVFPALIRPSTKLTVNVLENQLSAEAFGALLHLIPKKSLFTQLSYDSETHGARRMSNLDPRHPPKVSIESSCSPLTPYLLGVRGGQGEAIRIHRFRRQQDRAVEIDAAVDTTYFLLVN